jgi:hypothetical protein
MTVAIRGERQAFDRANMQSEDADLRLDAVSGSAGFMGAVVDRGPSGDQVRGGATDQYSVTPDGRLGLNVITRKHEHQPEQN